MESIGLPQSVKDESAEKSRIVTMKDVLPRISKIQSEKLHRQAIIVIFIHTFNSILILMLTLFVDELNNYTAPVLWYKPTSDRCTQTIVTVFDFSFGYAASAFCILSAVFHAITLVKWDDHIKQISDVNILRWAEYSLSAPIMAVAVAMLLGTRDVVTILSIFGSVHTLMWCGVYSDRVSRSDKYYYITLGGMWLGYTVSTSGIFMNLFGFEKLSQIPLVAWFFTMELLISFNSFGVWSCLRRYVKSETYESGYYWLSLFSKTTLAYTIVSGGFTENRWMVEQTDVALGIFPTTCNTTQSG